MRDKHLKFNLNLISKQINNWGEILKKKKTTYQPQKMLCFLDVPPLKLRIIIIFLSADGPEIFLPTARTTKNSVTLV